MNFTVFKLFKIISKIMEFLVIWTRNTEAFCITITTNAKQKKLIRLWPNLGVYKQHYDSKTK